MARVRFVDCSAKNIMIAFKKTGDLEQLIREISDAAAHFGRFGSYNRHLFTESLQKELKIAGYSKVCPKREEDNGIRIY